MTAKRLAALTGLLSVALIVASFAIGGETPDADETAQKAVDFYVKNDTDTLLAGILLAYAAVALTCFGTVLFQTLRRAEGDRGGASALSFAGAIIFALGLAIFGAINFVLGDVGDKLDPSAVQTLNAMNSDFFIPLAVGVATFLLGSGIAIVKTAALPKWLGWIAVAFGLLAVTPVGFFAFLASGIWIIIASIMLAMRAGEGAPATTP